MAYKQSKVGKPALSDVVGAGTSEKIKMSCAGQVFALSNDVQRDSISRDPGQDKPHMKVSTDPDAPNRLNSKHKAAS